MVGGDGMGRKRTKFSDATEVYHIRLTKEASSFLKGLGDSGPDIVRSLIDGYRLGNDGGYVDREIERARAKVMNCKTDLLESERELSKFETAKARLIDNQLSYLKVRQMLLEEYIHNPSYFTGWLSAEHRLHFVTDGKFESPRDVLEWCKVEAEGRRMMRR